MSEIEIDSVQTAAASKTKRKFNKKFLFLLLLIPVIFVSVFGGIIGKRTSDFNKTTEAKKLSVEQLFSLENILKEEFPERYDNLKSLPYVIAEPELDILAESAILIDMQTGNILYSKNPDEVIPPASLTKLFAMYVVDEAVSEGIFDYDTVIPLPPECWACNMPPHSSLMFLGEGQVVTVEELLLGLSICSGNDAAYALAYAVCGNMEDFVQRMNDVAAEFGLKNTHFVESSGYSELNTTTPREMAAFARIYLLKHPDSLARYHSVREFTYPKAKNMAPGDRLKSQDWTKGLPRHITMGITQKNTNPLLDLLDGCDGLKTGYIDESGYNLALTVCRNNTRFLSVTMKGPGRNTKEGQEGRVHDGNSLMDWAFASFADTEFPELEKKYFVKCYGAKEKAVELVPAAYFTDGTIASAVKFCLPCIANDTVENILASVEIQVDLPDYLFGEVVQGQVYGQVQLIAGEYILDTIPLVADRSLEKENKFFTFIDNIIKK